MQRWQASKEPTDVSEALAAPSQRLATALRFVLPVALVGSITDPGKSVTILSTSPTFPSPLQACVLEKGLAGKKVSVGHRACLQIASRSAAKAICPRLLVSSNYLTHLLITRTGASRTSLDSAVLSKSTIFRAKRAPIRCFSPAVHSARRVHLASTSTARFHHTSATCTRPFPAQSKPYRRRPFRR